MKPVHDKFWNQLYHRIVPRYPGGPWFKFVQIPCNINDLFPLSHDGDNTILDTHNPSRK